MAALGTDKPPAELVYVDQRGKPISKDVAEAWLQKNAHKMVSVEVKRPLAPVSPVQKSKRGGSCDDSQAGAMQFLIVSSGYSCRNVDFCAPNGWSPGLRVTCNDNRYAYTIVDVGGNLVVNVQ